MSVTENILGVLLYSLDCCGVQDCLCAFVSDATLRNNRVAAKKIHMHAKINIEMHRYKRYKRYLLEVINRCDGRFFTQK